MNILMVHPHDLYSSSEPWTIRIKKIAEEFIKRGNSVKVVYFPLDHCNAGKVSSDKGIEFISFDRRLGLVLLLKNVFKMIELSKWADVIHFQKCYYYAVLPALIASWINNKPLHYDWDDWETKIFYYSNPSQIFIGEFLNIFEKLLPGVVDTVSVSSLNLRQLSRLRGARDEFIFSAPVGADLEVFNPWIIEQHKGIVKKRYNTNKYLVMYVGQLHGGQYADLFIQAANLILKKRRDVSFMIIGEGYRLAELKDLAGGMGITDHLIFTGFVKHDDIPVYLADADVCVACFEENEITKSKSPLKIVEYLGSARAIVASNVGEVRNMIGGVGILVRPGDAVDLSNGIMLLLGDKKLRDALSNGAVERARKKYNWRVTANNILEAYNLAIYSRESV